MSKILEINEKIKNIIAEQLNIDIKKVIPSASFSKDLGADSLDIVELIMELEEQFDIVISDEDAQQILKVQDAIDYISQNTK